jgi:hypothetical protein
MVDETLVAAIRLSIPASEKTLPYPSSESSKTFPLPLETSVYEDDVDPSEAPPKLLLLLISALQISLECSYTAPRLGNSAAGTSTNQPEASTSSSNVLIPATHERDAAYQDVPLQRSSNNGEVTQMFTTSWKGIKIPNEIVDKNAAAASERERKQALDMMVEEDAPKNGGEIWYAEGKGEAKWVTEWRCRLPISECSCRTRAIVGPSTDGLLPCFSVYAYSTSDSCLGLDCFNDTETATFSPRATSSIAGPLFFYVGLRVSLLARSTELFVGRAILPRRVFSGKGSSNACQSRKATPWQATKLHSRQ